MLSSVNVIQGLPGPKGQKGVTTGLDKVGKFTARYILKFILPEFLLIDQTTI